ncbi:STAS domain-containing protein [Micromonospora sp. WMMD1274]|uniref:STAS domain-containing protein n=1 Tax=Micromonospora sp. WMMD1274 TaxID=3404116 RepID=UPI003B92D4DB
MLKIARRVEGNIVRLTLVGELDMATVEMLEAAVDDGLTEYRPHLLIIDLAGLVFCDSSGIRALLDACRAANYRGATFRATNACGMTRRVLQVTGVLDILTAESRNGCTGPGSDWKRV